LDLGFRTFFLPHGAQLFVSNENERIGPYTDADNPRRGVFFTPLVHGDHALLEVLLPRAAKPFLKLELGTLHAGYRDVLAPKSFLSPNRGSGACNIDTICPSGDGWRNEIAAEAILIIDGGFCSGQLVNNTRGDRRPLLTTANHCLATQGDADSLVVYWKYESP